jgi:hypothetical protein
MKIFIFIFLLLILAIAQGYAQTVIPANLTVDSFSKKPDGLYKFYRATVPKDSVDMGKNTQVPCPKQRTVKSYRYNSTTRKTTFTYDDGTTSVL